MKADGLLGIMEASCKVFGNPATIRAVIEPKGSQSIKNARDAFVLVALKAGYTPDAIAVCLQRPPDKGSQLIKTASSHCERDPNFIYSVQQVAEEAGLLLQFDNC